MAGHIHGRINGKLTMIMSDTNTKIWFVLLATSALCCAGCQSTQQVRQNEIMEARQMVEAQFGEKLSPEQKAQLSMQLYQQMEASRALRDAQSAAIIAQGFQNAGNTIANSAPQPNYITPVQPAYPSLKGSVIDPVYTQPATPTTHYIGDSSSIPVYH
jgi:hypothetical protein